jgi:hypothetical protein
MEYILDHQDGGHLDHERVWASATDIRRLVKQTDLRLQVSAESDRNAESRCLTELLLQEHVIVSLTRDC